MSFSHTRFVNICPLVLVFFIIILVMAGQPAISMAADTDRATFQSILGDSLEALWTGQEFSPALARRQQALKTMLTSGEVNKTELENMMGATFFKIMDRHKTSRYILRTMPERVNALFSPHMEWPAVKEVLWRSASSVVEKNAPLIITTGTLAPPGTPWINVPETIIFPEIERLSDGKVLFKIYGAGVMGEDTDILMKMAAGQIDGCGCTALGVLEACPEAAVLLTPGLFSNYDEVDYILEKFRKRLDRAFEKKGYIVVSFIDSGFFYLFSKNKITSLDKLKQQRVMALFGGAEARLYRELGVNASHVEAPDAPAALNSGQFDTYLASPTWMLGMQAYQYSNFYYKPSFFYSPGAIFISTRAVSRLRKQAGVSETYAHNVKELIISEFKALEPEWKRQLRHYEEKSLKAFESKCGIKSMIFSTEDQQTIKRAGKAVQQKMADNVFPKDFIDDIQKALEDYRASH